MKPVLLGILVLGAFGRLMAEDDDCLRKAWVLQIEAVSYVNDFQYSVPVQTSASSPVELRGIRYSGGIGLIQNSEDRAEYQTIEELDRSAKNRLCPIEKFSKKAVLFSGGLPAGAPLGLKFDATKGSITYSAFYECIRATGFSLIRTFDKTFTCDNQPAETPAWISAIEKNRAIWGKN